MSNKNCCEWSKYNGGCGDPCDFKDLEYTKEAILERIRLESINMDQLKRTVVNLKDKSEAEAIFSRIADKIAGMKIMTNRLSVDFGVPLEEVGKLIKSTVKRDPITDARIALALARARFKR